jgi:hypothetical protein
MIDASVSAVALAAPERGQVGERVVVYFDTIGRVEGEIVRHLDEGFVIKLTGRSRAGDALAELVERHDRDAPMSQADRPIKVMSDRDAADIAQSLPAPVEGS